MLLLDVHATIDPERRSVFIKPLPNKCDRRTVLAVQRGKEDLAPDKCAFSQTSRS